MNGLATSARSWLSLLTLLGLSLCWLLSSSSTFGDGISGSGIDFGRISQFRSVVINGIHYDTTNAIVRSNGRLGDLSDLELGQVILARVDSERLIALEIDQYDAVSGRIGELELEDETLAALTLEVAGQEVRVGLETVIHIHDMDEPGELHKLKVNDYVAIGGFRDDDGVIHASSLEEVDKDNDRIISGLIERIEDDGFRIGDATITSPYFAELLLEPWFREGAPVLVRSSTPYEDGELAADSVIRIPLEAVKGQDVWGYTDTRLDGEIEEYDPLAGTMIVGGLELIIDEQSTMQDERDELREFGLFDLYPSDHVSVALEERNGVLRVKKLVRHKKVKHFLRSRLKAVTDDAEAIETVKLRIRHVSETKELKFRGRKSEKIDFEEADGLFELFDAVELEWKKDGELKRIEVVANCDGVLDRLKQEHAIDWADKDAVKDLRKALKEEDQRAYRCL